MAKNTSISLGDHFESFVSERIESGRYSNVSEVVRASLRLLEEHEQKVEALRGVLIEGDLKVDGSVTTNGKHSVVLIAAAEYAALLKLREAMSGGDAGVDEAFKAIAKERAAIHKDVLDGLSR